MRKQFFLAIIFFALFSLGTGAIVIEKGEKLKIPSTGIEIEYLGVKGDVPIPIGRVPHNPFALVKVSHNGKELDCVGDIHLFGWLDAKTAEIRKGSYAICSDGLSVPLEVHARDFDGKKLEFFVKYGARVYDSAEFELKSVAGNLKELEKRSNPLDSITRKGPVFSPPSEAIELVWNKATKQGEPLVFGRVKLYISEYKKLVLAPATEIKIENTVDTFYVAAVDSTDGHFFDCGPVGSSTATVLVSNYNNRVSPIEFSCDEEQGPNYTLFRVKPVAGYGDFPDGKARLYVHIVDYVASGKKKSFTAKEELLAKNPPGKEIDKGVIKLDLSPASFLETKYGVADYKQQLEKWLVAVHGDSPLVFETNNRLSGEFLVMENIVPGEYNLFSTIRAKHPSTGKNILVVLSGKMTVLPENISLSFPNNARPVVPVFEERAFADSILSGKIFEEGNLYFFKVKKTDKPNGMYDFFLKGSYIEGDRINLSEIEQLWLVAKYPAGTEKVTEKAIDSSSGKELVLSQDAQLKKTDGELAGFYTARIGQRKNFVDFVNSSFSLGENERVFSFSSTTDKGYSVERKLTVINDASVGKLGKFLPDRIYFFSLNAEERQKLVESKISLYNFDPIEIEKGESIYFVELENLVLGARYSANATIKEGYVGTAGYESALLYTPEKVTVNDSTFYNLPLASFPTPAKSAFQILQKFVVLSNTGSADYNFFENIVFVSDGTTKQVSGMLKITLEKKPAVQPVQPGIECNSILSCLNELKKVIGEQLFGSGE